MPNASPTATRTAGAISATTRTVGSPIASQTSSTLEWIVIAPVGQYTRHCPQFTQLVWAIGRSNAVETRASAPLLVNSRTPSPCSSEQALTQSPQRMHLFMFLTIDGELVSIGCTSRVSW